ncbi:Nucleotide-binding universal stress protein, UspA family [Arenibacter nanhaiticus]|uniref:Nucleotide-binding universal stress protein, UspA family n=1 Tax=Arenibacter nanhaiticus TaxID=558155 RepID=A0A1M6DWV9_9FLAO|nr:universal stress protein [Arenibacter nanhaiticus]SHI77682.1 Nucleotide-binding universal stress protein, UspA family [Arenibacter nanhaiticus]
MKKILLPTDFSNRAQKAIDYAVYLLEKHDCTFYILHAYYRNIGGEDAVKASKEGLAAIIKKMEAKKENKHHRFMPVSINDSPVNAINCTVMDWNIECVFMGTKGASAIENVLFGSTTMKAIQLVQNCPIIAVPENYDYDIPDEVVFANDYKSEFQKSELNPLIQICQWWNSALTVVHIASEKQLTESQEANRESLREMFKTVKPRFLEVPRSTSIAATLLLLEKENQHIGMVAMVYNKRSFFEKLLREAVVHHLVFVSKVPFLALPKAK